MDNEVEATEETPKLFACRKCGGMFPLDELTASVCPECKAKTAAPAPTPEPEPEEVPETPEEPEAEEDDPIED